jgi:hypothetical protein
VTVLDRYGHLLPREEDTVTDALDAMAQTVPSRPLATVTEIPADISRTRRAASARRS